MRARGLGRARQQRIPGTGRNRPFAVATAGNKWQISGVSSGAFEEETSMPVILLWAVPTVVFIGGVGYLLVRAVH
jgi:hypothetical protein